MSRMRAADLVPYGHPATWPGESLRTGITWDQALDRLLCGRPGPGYVLGIDQAKSSGYALQQLGRVRRASECVLHGRAVTSLQQREALKSMRAMLAREGFDWRNVLVVFEDHGHLPVSKGGNTRTVLGLGHARGLWWALLDILEHPVGQRLLSEPAEWRRVLGTTARLDRAAWKQQAVFWASAQLGARVEDDEAEAYVMARWGAWDGLYRWAFAQLGDGKGATRARTLMR